MRKVKERALIERAKRHFDKQNLILKKHKLGTTPIMNISGLYVYALDKNTGSPEWGVDATGFEEYCKKEFILKVDEEIDYN